MSLANLYQEVILDHNKSPRNFGDLEKSTNSARGHNPLCGDELHVKLIIDNDKIKDIKFTGSGCAICMASASIMTESVISKDIEKAQELFKKVHDLLTNNQKNDDIGKLAILENVSQYPARVKCATLAWHTLESALGNSDTATTE